MIEKAQIEAALATVYDPCSVQANAPLSVIDMGLVTQIDVVSDDAVHIRVRPTSAWCTMIGSIMIGVETQVLKVEGVKTVTVDIEPATIWTEADMTPQGRELLEGVRARSRAAVPVRRRQWQERIPKSNEV